MYSTFFISFLTTLALHVSSAIIRSTTAAYSHTLCMVWCVIALEQVLVSDSFTVKCVIVLEQVLV
jgi:hypothetical protein